MEKIISNITLIGVDCIDLERLKLAADISTKEISFGKVKLLSSIPSDDPRVVKISPIKSIKEYSDFMIKELDKYIDTDFALVFQYDGFVLNASAWSDDFLKYDYYKKQYRGNDVRIKFGIVCPSLLPPNAGR